MAVQYLFMEEERTFMWMLSRCCRSQVSMELFLEPVTRLRARKMKEHDDSVTNGLLAFLEEAMKVD